jgi:cytoskeleton protein RodZ
MSDGLEPMALGQTSAIDPSAGALLRNAREAHGLHIAALAVSLKVPVKKIEALEADRIDLLPDAVFARALAASVCRALKVDPTEILARLPQTNTPRLNQGQQNINTPFRMPANGPGQSKLTALSKPTVLAVLALLLGALVLIFLPDVTKHTSDAANAAVAGLKSSTSISSSNAAGAATTTGSDNPSSGTAMGAGTPVFSTTEGGVTATAVPGAPVEGAAPANPGVTAAVTPSVTRSTPTVASPTLVITTDLSASTPASMAADGMVVFRAKGQTWVEVIDARGQVTLRRTLQAGEAAGANGAPPLRVTVGRADQTQVLVRGKPFEDEARVRDNVLRFEVK